MHNPEPEYVRETMYTQRSSKWVLADLVYFGHDDSIQDIPRDFPSKVEFHSPWCRNFEGHQSDNSNEAWSWQAQV